MWRDWPGQVCAATGREGIVYSRRGYGQSESIPDVRGAGRLAPDYMHREAVDVLPDLAGRPGHRKARSCWAIRTAAPLPCSTPAICP